MVNILWVMCLGFIYLFIMFMTPQKAPLPVVKQPEIVEIRPEAAPSEVSTTESKVGPVTEEQNPIDIEKGKQIYLSACIKCHNKDPNIKGSIGPEMVDAPLEVMEHKIATGRYPDVLPPGFVPKRKTKLMQKFPQYVKDAPSIHAYVQSLKKK